MKCSYLEHTKRESPAVHPVRSWRLVCDRDGDVGGGGVAGAGGGGFSALVGLARGVGVGWRLEQDRADPADAGSALAVDPGKAEPKASLGVETIEADRGDAAAW